MKLLIKSLAAILIFGAALAIPSHSFAATNDSSYPVPSNPFGVGFAPDGTMYIATSNWDAYSVSNIYRVKPDGSFDQFLSNLPGGAPVQVRASTDGHVWVQYPSQVLEFGVDGVRLATYRPCQGISSCGINGIFARGDHATVMLTWPNGSGASAELVNLKDSASTILLEPVNVPPAATGSCCLVEAANDVFYFLTSFPTSQDWSYWQSSITKVTLSGDISTVQTSQPVFWSQHMSIDADGNLLISQTRHDIIELNLTTGEIVNNFGQLGDNQGVAVSPIDGTVWAAYFWGGVYKVGQVSTQTVPSAPTVNAPSSPASGQLTWTWSPNATGGSAITSYSWSGACSGSGNVTTVTCTGLTGGQSYSLSVTATNAMGTGPSAASTLKMPITSPDSVAPRITVAGTSFTASWAAPHNGGAALTGYTVTVLGANNKLISSTTLKSTVLTFTQSKLTTGATYTLSIAAANTSLLTSSPFVSSVTPKNPETLTVPAKLSYSYGSASTKVSVSLSIKATGTVSFTTGSTTLCVANVSSTAVNCSVNSTLLNAGSYPLSVSYSGDSLTSIAIRAGTLTVTPASSTLKVSTNVNAVTSARLGALLVSTSLGSTIGSIPPGIVSLSLDGAQITTNAATFAFATWKPSKPLTKGVHTLTANYGGSTNYSAVSAFCKFVVQ